MSKIKCLIYPLLTILLFARCQKEASIPYSSVGQHLFFQVEYTNMAWGSQHSGILIDWSGNVHAYNLPVKWNYFDGGNKMSAIQMEQNLMATDSVILKIGNNELNSKIKLINDAAAGNISEPKQQMYDAGALVYSCFVYDAKTFTYNQVILKQWGDFFIENDSGAA